ncbi:hypothetical protein roselon_00479 [Roseibacterium elongatum DSM 19469]|uniref:Uncharacterized protein n=1 Tax=Roseicyclus elongatus DSM 19469 TaxID=1294273 RepID=W8SKA8_9RHOB|nr:hypothetical protein [Roseibacterium elongatum]AHM02920.1 hypothetical protein roselon_00479 [Roseibacterium elongatum DSM 19469]
MSDAPLDPDLIGIWIVPGQPQTYEVSPDGVFHVADPEEPLAYEEDGRIMTFGARRLIRQVGSGETPVGGWSDVETRDIWAFGQDQSYSVNADGVTETGMWSLRDGGDSLWLCEDRATITTDGAHLTFRTGPDAATGLGAPQALRYGYTVEDGIWRVLDPDRWTELTRYVSLARLERMSGAG